MQNPIRLFFSAFFLLYSFAVSAQDPLEQFQLKNHTFAKTSAFIHINTTDNRQNMFWDFSEMTLLEKDVMVKYSVWNDSILAGVENGMRYYYQASSDGLLLYGYENAATNVSYDYPEKIMSFPLSYGKTWNNVFHGTAIHGDRLFLRQYGILNAKVDATGFMLVPGGDTLSHVCRVHIRELTAEQYFPQITTEEELLNMVYTTSPFTEDSIRQHVASDSLLTEMNIYRWYAAGYRYPILEYVEVGPKDGSPQYIYTYYCSIEEQASLDDAENENIRVRIKELDHQNDGLGIPLDEDKGKNPPIKNISVTVSGTMVFINYDLMNPATVKVIICNTQGMVLRQSSQQSHVGNDNSLQLSCAGLRHGQYILYLAVNGAVISQLINI